MKLKYILQFKLHVKGIKASRFQKNYFNMRTDMCFFFPLFMYTVSQLFLCIGFSYHFRLRHGFDILARL